MTFTENMFFEGNIISIRFIRITDKYVSVEIYYRKQYLGLFKKKLLPATIQTIDGYIEDFYNKCVYLHLDNDETLYINFKGEILLYDNMYQIIDKILIS